MKKGESSRLEALEALIAEKRRHESYLAKLDGRREGTPEHVYAKLRDEYLMKLTDAQVRAQTEADAVAGGLDEDEAAIAEVEERLEALNEEKVEGELRAAVGELDAREWTKKLTSLSASISLAERERDARTAVVERTRALLAEAHGESPTAAPHATDGSAKGGAKGRQAGMTGGPSFDELAFLHSVVGRKSSEGAPVPPAARGSKGVDQVRDDLTEESDDEPEAAADDDEPPSAAPSAKAAKSSKASKAAKTDAAPNGSGDRAKVPDEDPPPVAQEADAPSTEPVVEGSSAEPDDAFGRPTPRTSQAVKTLKCQECGTFNYPTEWYCERCGGELAAL